jgi:pilus assembly protein CpaC
MKKSIFFCCLSLIFSSVFSVNAESIINLSRGGAETITTQQDIATVFLSDPTVADYQVIDKRKLLIFGKEIGETSILVFGEDNETVANKKLMVNKSLLNIQQYISARYPSNDVNIFNIGEQVVLTGTVPSEAVKEDINTLVGELLEKSSEKRELSYESEGEGKEYTYPFMTVKDYDGIVNNLTVATTKQLNVKISIAEVSQSLLEDIGIDYTAGPTSAAGTFIQRLTKFSSSNLLTTIRAHGDESIGQILAEPNLSVISGESASFLVGGEIPVVTTVNNTPNVQFKEFGIRLELLAKVKNNDKITLALMPEVSSLDSQYTDGSFNLPALKTRRARTTVELEDGQSFVLGGLLNSEDRERLMKVPLIGDIPILGALFRHSVTNRVKTELIIVATVNLVEPIHPSQVQLPTMRRTTSLSRFFGVSSTDSKASDKWTDEILAVGGFKK